MKKHSLIAALILAISAPAFAGETAPVFDAKNCKADYPKTALLNEEQGVTVASFLVAPDGRVVDSKLDKSSGSRTLDKATLKAIGECKFKPGTRDGVAFQAWTKVEYAWTL